MIVILWVRWFLGATIFSKEIWKTRVVKDNDTFEEVLEGTDRLKADGWQDFAAIGDTLYLRKRIERWPYPTSGTDVSHGGK